MTSALQHSYQQLIDSGQLQPDEAQATAVHTLGPIQQEWQSGDEGKSSGFLSKFISNKTSDTPQGIYLWGDVGRGKSMLMDLLFDTSAIKPKKRIHYHAFIADIHGRIHQWRRDNAEDAKRKDPILPVAEAVAQEASLLCLDELQVHDVADAMILSRLFTHLLKCGVRVVFTSNRKPDDLYLHGLQRDRFLQFVELVNQRFEVIELASAEDYRLKQLRSMEETFIVAKSGKAKAQMDKAFAAMTHGAEAKREVLDVQGHNFPIPAAHGDVARFTFDDLCAKAFGAVDYLALAQAFNTVLIDDIPILKPEKRNEAKRFVTLIDTLYEHKVKLICSAAAKPDKLYPKGDGSFEFARTASRLHEMQSQSYLAAAHKVA